MWPRISLEKCASIGRSWSSLPSLWEMWNQMQGLWRKKFLFYDAQDFGPESYNKDLGKKKWKQGGKVRWKPNFSDAFSNMTGCMLRTRSTCTTRSSRGSRGWSWGRKKLRLEISSFMFFKTLMILQMNGTPGGRTSRIKRRAESRQEINFIYLKFDLKKVLFSLYLYFLIICIVFPSLNWMDVGMWCKLCSFIQGGLGGREEEKKLDQRGLDDGKALTAFEAKLIQPGGLTSCALHFTEYIPPWLWDSPRRFYSTQKL